jgi:hypothetical protein
MHGHLPRTWTCVAPVSKAKAAPVAQLEHVPQKWEPVLRKRTCSNKELEQDDDSKKSHPALGIAVTRMSVGPSNAPQTR